MNFWKKIRFEEKFRICVKFLDFWVKKNFWGVIENFVYNDFRVRFVSWVKLLAAFLLAPWREAGVINSVPTIT